MTEDDKALVKRLREVNSLIAIKVASDAANRIEALSAENERLRQALQDVSAIWRRHKYSGDFDLWLNAHIRAALGETK